MTEYVTLTEPAYAPEDPNETFHVYQFFDDGVYERVRESVSLSDAKKAATHYTTAVAASLGVISRVIICDSGDRIVFEWKHRQGVVFPKG